MASDITKTTNEKLVKRLLDEYPGHGDAIAEMAVPKFSSQTTTDTYGQRGKIYMPEDSKTTNQTKKELMRRLYDYADHSQSCAVRFSPTNECNCGFDDLVKEYEACDDFTN